MNLPTYLSGTVQMQSYSILRTYVYEVLTVYDLTPTYWSMLGIILDAQDGIRQAEIARQMRVKAPLITPMVRVLEDKKIIQTVPNQFDARAKLVSVTPKGKRFMKNVESSMHKMLEELLSGLTDKDMMTYHKVLTTIIANDARIQLSRSKQ